MRSRSFFYFVGFEPFLFQQRVFELSILVAQRIDRVLLLLQLSRHRLFVVAGVALEVLLEQFQLGVLLFQGGVQEAQATDLR